VRCPFPHPVRCPFSAPGALPVFRTRSAARFPHPVRCPFSAPGAPRQPSCFPSPANRLPVRTLFAARFPDPVRLTSPLASPHPPTACPSAPFQSSSSLHCSAVILSPDAGFHLSFAHPLQIVLKSNNSNSCNHLQIIRFLINLAGSNN
jgi:hypothetical protein